MSTTGALNLQPVAYPAGTGPAGCGGCPSTVLIQSGGSCREFLDASMPASSRTPVAGLSSISSSLASVTVVHRTTRSSIPTRCGPQSAPAAAEVVACGGAAACTPTASPASARQMAVVRPETPAPMTTASSSRLLML